MLKREDAEKLIEMIGVLFEDVSECEDRLADSDTQFWRRVFVRASFSFVEGMTVLLKQQALVGTCNKITATGEIDFARLSVLCGESYFIDDSGELRWRRITIPALNNVAFAFREFAQLHGASYQLDRSGGDWQALRSATRVRDRLVHPKALQDLDVTDAELSAVEKAVSWLNDSVALLLSEAQRKLQQRGT